MPPRRACKVQLATVLPSDDELAAARAILASADAKTMRSKKACMKTFARANEDEDAITSAGDQQKAYLEKYLVHIQRMKKSTTKTKVVKE